MASEWAVLIPAAIGLSLSPVPLVELILVLLSKRRAVNAVVFVVALLVFTAILLTLGALGGAVAESDSAEPSLVVGWVFLLLGGLLLVMGVRNWRQREDTSEPAVLASIAKMGPAAVAFLAFGAVFVNPKNTVLIVTSGQIVGQSDLPVVYGAAFVLLATSPYWVAAGYSLFGGQAAADRLDRFRAWLVARNRLIMGVICSLLGLILVARSIQIILG